MRTHDAKASMGTRTTSSHTYILTPDADNRLRQVKKNGARVASFGYDGDGRMVTAVEGVATTDCVSSSLRSAKRLSLGGCR